MGIIIAFNILQKYANAMAQSNCFTRDYEQLCSDSPFHQPYDKRHEEFIKAKIRP
jgi:hypothetical protein